MIWETLKYLLGGLLVAACFVILGQRYLFASSHIELVNWLILLVLLVFGFYTLVHDRS